MRSSGIYVSSGSPALRLYHTSVLFLLTVSYVKGDLKKKKKKGLLVLHNSILLEYTVPHSRARDARDKL